MYEGNAKLGSAVEKNRETQVVMATRELSRAIERATAVAQEIAKRLDSVSRPNPQTTGGTDKPPREVLCGLADELRNYSESVGRLAFMLEDQLQRLEI